MSRAVILSLASLTDDDEGDVALPAEIKSELGSVVERVVLSTKRATTVLIPDEPRSAGASADHSGHAGTGLSFVVVELTTRHGPNITRRIPVVGRFAQHTIDLVPDDIPDWLMWAAADVNLARHARISFRHTAAYEVWGRMWARRLGAWRPVSLVIDDDESNAYAKQFEVTTREPSVLEIGGPELPSRFVALPEGRAKVLLTANASAFDDDDPLNIVVSRISAGPRNSLLSLLSMHQSMHAENVAANALREGFDWQNSADDPLSACALGYAAMRLRAFDRFTLADATTLFQLARGSSDAAILLATRELVDDSADLSQVIRLLDVGIGRGLPVLAQSLAAASAALDALRRRAAQIDHKMLEELTEKARSYTRAKTGAGPFMSFHGRAPHVPGDPQATRGAIQSVGTAVANIASAFRPIPATPLIQTERSAKRAR
jgi:hypothetical protein